MISRITGRLRSVSSGTATLEVGSLWYDVLIPAACAGDLPARMNEEVVLYTVEYIDGNPSFGQMVPRLIGFPSELDRAFYSCLLEVKGVSVRKALRAMAVPTHHIAAAIENGDTRTLSKLPDIGPKTAAQIITDLRGKLEQFLAPAAVSAPLAQLTSAQQVALEILVGWGDRRADAQRWIARAVDDNPHLVEPEQIVTAAYRVKNSA